MNLTQTTQAKAAALHAAARSQPWDMPKLLAMLTSASKDEREQAKRAVRDMVKVGAEILRSEQDAQRLADFANRNEP